VNSGDASRSDECRIMGNYSKAQSDGPAVKSLELGHMNGVFSLQSSVVSRLQAAFFLRFTDDWTLFLSMNVD